MDEMCFLAFCIYMYLLLLIDVATVSCRGHLFSHARACALNSINLEQMLFFSRRLGNKVREMLTHLGTPLYITDNSCMHHVAKCVGNHNIL